MCDVQDPATQPANLLEWSVICSLGVISIPQMLCAKLFSVAARMRVRSASPSRIAGKVGVGVPGFAGNSYREQGASVGFVRAATRGIGCQWRAAHE